MESVASVCCKIIPLIFENQGNNFLPYAVNAAPAFPCVLCGFLRPLGGRQPILIKQWAPQGRFLKIKHSRRTQTATGPKP